MILSHASNVGYMMAPERVLRGELSVVLRLLINHHHDHHRQGCTKPQAIYSACDLGCGADALPNPNIRQNTLFAKRGSGTVNKGRKRRQK